MKKKLAVLAAASALTVAAAVPALAMENEFHGSFVTFYDLSNFNASGKVQEDAKYENFFVQRVRLNYNAKASDNVKLVTRFEMDYNYWGNSSYRPNNDTWTGARGGGGALGADTINIETKNLYLDLNYPAMGAKIGMMANNDAFKGLIFDADMAGILLSHSYTSANVNAGFFRWKDDSTGPLGAVTTDMFQLDGKYRFTKDTAVGAGYYYVEDDTAGAEVHNIGINAEGKVGPVALNGFVLKQFGDRTTTADADGLAVNLSARTALGGGTLRTEFLYVSGGSDDAFFVAGGGDEGGHFYDSEMVVLGRDKNATSIDNAIIYNVNNFNEGVILGAVGYDYTFTDKLSASANIGFAAIADEAPGVAEARDINKGSSDYLGTEINAEANYSLTPNVTLGARGGYVFLGDYFASSFDNPYDVKLIARYTF